MKAKRNRMFPVTSHRSVISVIVRRVVALNCESEAHTLWVINILGAHVWLSSHACGQTSQWKKKKRSNNKISKYLDLTWPSFVFRSFNPHVIKVISVDNNALVNKMRLFLFSPSWKRTQIMTFYHCPFVILPRTNQQQKWHQITVFKRCSNTKPVAPHLLFFFQCFMCW